MDELVKQVELLSNTLRLSVERIEEAFKLFTERANNLARLEAELLILKEALIKSLSESDGQVDDMARITAALLKATADLEALQQEQEDQEG